MQAVGSAAGALAAHEASLRLIGDGRFGERVPRLLLSQNAPFTPIHDAWAKRAQALEECTPLDARARQHQIAATVLGNPAPPYATAGGVRDALAQSGGFTYAVANGDMADAMALFAALEGVDIEPAAGVAVASLVRAARDGSVNRDDVVLLNVTGGGRSLRAPVREIQRPAAIVARAEIDAAIEVAAA